MESLLFALLTLAARWLEPRHNAQIQLLREQIRILRARVDAERIVPTPAERAELLRIGALLDHEVAELMHVVRPATYRRWRREQKSGHVPKKAGRPPTVQCVRDLVERMARENLRWGYRRIVGELRKLGISLCAATARNFLHEAGIHPTPEKSRKTPSLPWKQFIEANIDSMIATDFLTKEVCTLTGRYTAYVLIIIHLGSRKAYASPATYSPHEGWVVQQGRNARMWLEDEGLEARFLVHDGDAKFSAHFRESWKPDARCLRTPPRSPMANSYAESFIGTLKHECLNHFVCFSPRQLDRIVSLWMKHYNYVRPHQGKEIGNNVLDVNFQPQTAGEVRCKRQLGGIITHYYREAA
ncbi:MAG: transposase [Candidatus Hydrogenedens sp.]|nr:transposase [Candidatus Hydrogenedens sp.]